MVKVDLIKLIRPTQWVKNSFVLAPLLFTHSFNSLIKGFWKSFLIIEPFISIIITFGGFFIIRFVNTDFSYIINDVSSNHPIRFKTINERENDAEYFNRKQEL